MTITSKVDLRQAILDSLTFSSISILCCLCPSSCLSRRFAYSQSNSACPTINDIMRCHRFQFEMVQKKKKYFCIKLICFVLFPPLLSFLSVHLEGSSILFHLFLIFLCDCLGCLYAKGTGDVIETFRLLIHTSVCASGAER